MAARLVQRSDAGVQRHRHAVARPFIRARAAKVWRRAQYSGRDLGRYRLQRRIRHARQAGHPGVHAVPLPEDEPVSDRSDVFPARAQHFQPRGARRVRRLPGHRQGGQQRCRVQGRLRHRHGQLDQLGAGRGANRLLLQRLAGRHQPRRPGGFLRGALRQFRQHLRGLHRQAHGPADPPLDPGHQRKQRARRIFPHRRLSGAQNPSGGADQQPVDGYFQGVQLRTLHLRRGRTRP